MNWNTLRENSVTFTVDALGGATFTLGFEGNPYDGGKYTLSVNKTSFNDLPEFKEEVEVPKIGHTSPVRHNGSSIHRVDFPVFLSGHRTPVSIEHNLRSGMIALDVNGKPKKSW